MKKIYFTIVLFITGFIATAIFAAFNYSIIDIGDSNSSSMVNGINNSGEVFDIEDEKNNFVVPNAERVVSISNNDSVQIGGASDTSVMLAVTGGDGEAADASNDIVSGEQSVTEGSENSDQTAGNDDTTQPLVCDNSLIAALEMPSGYSPVEIPFGRNSIGRVVGYSGVSGVTSSSGASGVTSSSGVSGGTSSSAVSGVISSGVESETASSSNESKSTSSSGVSETASSPNLIENSVNSNQGTSDLLSPDSAGELILWIVPMG